MTDSYVASASTIADGGPVYPSNELGYNGEFIKQNLGMSLRDWFAGQALPMITQAVNDCPPSALTAVGVNVVNRAEVAAYIARKTYELADAMLAERAKAVSP